MILCCGEALIDMIPGTTPGGDAALVPMAGGAVFNTAIALGRLGAPSAMWTGLSRDRFGRQLHDALQDAGVDTALVTRSDRPTTLAFVDLGDGQATYLFYDENSAGRMLGTADSPALPDAVELLYFGGISLCNPPAADSYAALAAQQAGRRAIVIDPNIRPGFISDEPAYRARLNGMLALADLVKVSDDDLAWICPDAADDGARVRALQDMGARVVVVTRGGDGAVGHLPGGQTVTVPAVPAQVVDTVGAGDTFNAGMLARAQALGLLSREALAALTPEALADILSFGARVAAVTVSRAGANPPWQHEI
ncbi:MAG: carbohydrate kinase [Pseudomonadota bacterium]|nr:carbohydrate kinase [Pseudomonadota bacterium]